MPSLLAHAFHDAGAFGVPAPLAALVLAGVLLGTSALARRWWPVPPLATAGPPRPLPEAVATVLRVGAGITRAAALLGLGVLVLVALVGPRGDAPNLAPVAVVVLAWAGLLLGSAVGGDVWSRVGPYAGLAALVRRGRPARTAPEVAGAPVPAAPAALPGEWSAPVLLAAYLWLQQAYHDPGSPTATAVFLVGYTVAVGVGLWRWGPAWVRYGEGFAALGRLVAMVAPIGRDPGGRVVLRAPLSGIAAPRPRGPDAAVLVLAVGAMLFDALVYAPAWVALATPHTGLARSALHTAGLAWMVAAVAVVAVVARRFAARAAGQAALPRLRGAVIALVPVLLGLAAAVDGALAIFSARLVLILVSDPLGLGWDLLGTARDTVSVGLLASPAAIYLQVAAILAAGVVAVVTCHDRALAATAAGSQPAGADAKTDAGADAGAEIGSPATGPLAAGVTVLVVGALLLVLVA